MTSRKPDGPLRRGWTTGACATAGVTAAYVALLTGRFPDPVMITLPKGERPSFALSRAERTSDDEATAALQPILMRLCATYLLEARQGERALDRVAHFHLSNGARLERINWLADTSANGLEQAAGTMVNYLYRLADIEKNHESYRGAGKIAAAPAVKRLV